jgi:ORF6N domain-containing protein
MKNSSLIIPATQIERRIFYLRGVKVMLSVDLAELYGVAVKALNQAVRRNLNRFPKDFMFQLNLEEFDNLKSQIVTSSWGGMRRALPYAFTEQGIAMLSGVLKSQRAIQVNIEIMRTFVKLGQLMASSNELSHKIDELEKKYDHQFQIVFDAIRGLMTPLPARTKPIGFRPKTLKK